MKQSQQPAEPQEEDDKEKADTSKVDEIKKAFAKAKKKNESGQFLMK